MMLLDLWVLTIPLLYLLIYFITYDFFIYNIYNIYDREFIFIFIVLNLMFMVIMYVYLFSTDFLTISCKYKSYESKYFTILPKNYFVKMTNSMVSRNFGTIIDIDEYPIRAYSISSFCSTRGSTSNKLLSLHTTILSIAFFSVGYIYEKKYIIYYLIAAFGLLLIGLAESRYNEWVLLHFLGILMLISGILVISYYREVLDIKDGYNIFIFIISLLFGIGSISVYVFKVFKKRNLKTGIYAFILISLEYLFLNLLISKVIFNM